jgi:hypothetical protein
MNGRCVAGNKKEEPIGNYIPTARAAAENIAKSVKKARQKVLRKIRQIDCRILVPM